MERNPLNIIGQTNLNEWDVIDENIKRSKIKRYPYKQLINQSLTNYTYMGNNKHEAQKIYDNIKISVCARFSEEYMRGRI